MSDERAARIAERLERFWKAVGALPTNMVGKTWWIPDPKRGLHVDIATLIPEMPYEIERLSAELAAAHAEMAAVKAERERVVAAARAGQWGEIIAIVGWADK